MENTLVTYCSQYGSAKKYAAFIAEELGCGCIEARAACGDVFGPYETVVFCGSLYAGAMNGLRGFLKNSAAIDGKRLVLVVCGLNDPAGESIAVSCENVKKTLPASLAKNAAVFYARGGIKYAKLNFMHRFMMKMMCRLLKKKDPEIRTAEEENFLAQYGKSVDYVSKKNIEPVIRLIRSGG